MVLRDCDAVLQKQIQSVNLPEKRPEDKAPTAFAAVKRTDMLCSPRAAQETGWQCDRRRREEREQAPEGKTRGKPSPACAETRRCPATAHSSGFAESRFQKWRSAGMSTVSRFPRAPSPNIRKGGAPDGKDLLRSGEARHLHPVKLPTAAG